MITFKDYDGGMWRRELHAVVKNYGCRIMQGEVEYGRFVRGIF